MKRDPVGKLGAVLLAHNEIIEHQGNASIALMAALVGALSESGHLDASRFTALVARAIVTIYGDTTPPAHFLKITEAVTAFAVKAPRPTG